MRRAILTLALLPCLLLAYDQTLVEAPHFEAACEGRWPGRFVPGPSAGTLYDCQRAMLVDAASPFGCETTTLEICYEDE